MALVKESMSMSIYFIILFAERDESEFLCVFGSTQCRNRSNLPMRSVHNTLTGVTMQIYALRIYVRMD